MKIIPGGGSPGNSWWGCIARFSKSWPYFRRDLKNVIFYTRFQTWSLRNHSSLLRLDQQQKRYLTACKQTLFYFSFHYFSFGIETINAFIPSRSSLENHTRFQTCFQTKTVQKPFPLGWHIRIWLILKNYSTQAKVILIILSENGPSSWHNNFLDRLVDSLLHSHSLCRHTTLLSINCSWEPNHIPFPLY